MLARIRAGLSYANVMATIAVFLALGGGAYAALKLPKNSVGSKQIKKRAVTKAKLHKGAVDGSKVKDHSLTGRQINLAKLGTVPNAGHSASADSATTAGSAANAANGARRLDFNVPTANDAAPSVANQPAKHTVLTVGGLTVRASCIDLGGANRRIYVTFTSSVNARFEEAYIHDLSTPVANGFLIGPSSQRTSAVVDE